MIQLGYLQFLLESQLDIWQIQLQKLAAAAVSGAGVAAYGFRPTSDTLKVNGSGNMESGVLASGSCQSFQAKCMILQS